MFQAFSFGFLKRNKSYKTPPADSIETGFEAYQTETMISCAKHILQTSRQPEEAYLGALAVLMLSADSL